MTTLFTEVESIRRFLRDPDGNIWSDDDLITYWNDAQRELAIKAGYGERAETYNFPPQWIWSHTQPWEWGYCDGDRYQCLTMWQGGEMVVCYPWEAGYWMDVDGPADDGYRSTQPWEAFITGSPADYVPMALHADLQNIRYMAFDQSGMDPIDRKVIAMSDSAYRTAAGGPVFYWRPDAEGNQVVLYPRPTAITWDDGGLLHEPTETYADAGGTNTWETDKLDARAPGLITESLVTSGNLFVLYENIPRDVEDLHDEIDLAPYLVKYVRFGCLERALGADTDGFVPSLRDYWKTRKEIGIRAIKKLQILKNTDRDYCLGGGGGRGRDRHPRLPAEYPRQ